MTSQLRIYQIKPGKLDDWVAFWQEYVVPARAAHGFRVDGAWVTADGEFAWVVTHDAKDFAVADAAYYAGPERAAAPHDPMEFIDHAQVRMVRPVGT